MMTIKRSLSILFLAFFIVGCAGVPVREALYENLKVPSGNIEGNKFTGIRYPFKVSATSHWKMSTEFPDFLQSLGYDKPSPEDKEQNELYIFNPITQSTILFDLTPALPYGQFSQELQESRVTKVTGIIVGDLQKDYGKELQVQVAPTESISLKGVQFAAKKYVTYTLKGVKRQQGWVYGFSEPYQIFVLYVILEKEGANDRKDIDVIMNSFEFAPKK
jgi:hypothetical protein